MAERTYTTVDDDMVDLIAYEMYGTEEGRTALYEANPWLAEHPLELPAGLIVAVPDWQPEAPTVLSGGLLG